MATAAENLETSITQITARIVEVTASANPDYTENGRTISKGTYLTQLQQSLNELLALRPKIGAPWIYRSRGKAV